MRIYSSHVEIRACSLFLLSGVIRIAKGHLCAVSLGNILIKMAKCRLINQYGLYILVHY